MTQQTIKIDLDEARRAAGVLQQAHDDLTSELTALASAVDALLPTWDGNAKSQFGVAWDDWLRVMREVLSAIPPLASGIQREADAIEAADATSSYRM